MFIREFLNTDIVTEEAPLIILYSNSAVFINKNFKDTNHTSHISRIVNFVWNGGKWKMQKIDWCEGSIQLAEIATKNVGENDLNLRLEYTMVGIDNW